VNRNNPNILIVEDEDISRRALAMLLSASGYETEAVDSGEKALDVLAEGRVPRAALIDLDLPGMSGEELLRQIVRKSPSILPVLITAADRERIDALRQDHQVQCIRKPVDIQGLLSMLGRYLAN
jgi:CheY-like chemotaxis protein